MTLPLVLPSPTLTIKEKKKSLPIPSLDYLNRLRADNGMRIGISAFMGISYSDLQK